MKSDPVPSHDVLSEGAKVSLNNVSETGLGEFSELQTLCGALSDPACPRVGLSSEGEVRTCSGPLAGLPNTVPIMDNFAFCQSMQTTMSNIETHLVRLSLSLQADVQHVFDEANYGHAQEQGDSDVVWHSLVSDMQIHVSEIQRVRLKLYDFSSASVVRRLASSQQYDRCIVFQEKLLAFTRLVRR